ncbi:glycoside hydrolase family 30 beta sandwich domain-containing protein [Marinoscillum sp. MHG1-6]|uniref:glycoside hydrolase family 30 protein n=1 Tax=Marinoscillum sp. MHG1-6 TaxID=2959627 RepID=UPI002157B7FD|nr:glycoside hydrolase family 30 protein [Marinoscillum sp. MHG1-6]
MKKILFVGLGLLLFKLQVVSQSSSAFSVSTTQSQQWQLQSVDITREGNADPDVEIYLNQPKQTFYGWGTSFNELGWDALNMLNPNEREEILANIFSPDGDLRYQIGRIPIGANDYARDWYSCNEVDGDFKMKHFNIDRDLQTLIPFIKEAQEYNPDLKFWASPWSPPQWMKVNKHYANASGGNNGLSPENEVPRLQDQFIMEKKYLKAYALYFSRFIKAYEKEGIDISRLMYQNEAYQFSIYPNCSWSPEGTAIFNSKYLGPYFAKKHKDVELFLGTMNTGEHSTFRKILNYPNFSKYIDGVGFQWEGAKAIDMVRDDYPGYKLVQTESECGVGSFDWGAAVHTNNLINFYISNGCEEYTFWNVILKDNGASAWGWLQNALIRVNSSDLTYEYTPEYYAVKHNSHFVPSGSVRLATSTSDDPLLAYRTPDDNIIIVISNHESTPKTFKIKMGETYLIADLPAGSFNTLVISEPYQNLKLLIKEAKEMRSPSEFIVITLKAAEQLDENSPLSDILQKRLELASALTQHKQHQEKRNLLLFEIEKATRLKAGNGEKAELLSKITKEAAREAKRSRVEIPHLERNLFKIRQAIYTYQRAQNAGANNPLEVTSLIQNPSFRDGNTPDPSKGTSIGWTVKNSARSGDFRLNYLGGKNCWNNWSDNFDSMNVYQDIDNLVPGIYEVRCKAMTNEGTLHDQRLYARSSTQTTYSDTLSIDDKWNTPEGWDKLKTEKVLVSSDGKLRVGFTSTSGGGTKGWFCVTDFQLIYYGEELKEE